MPLVTCHDILVAARQEGRGVGAFNIANYETTKAVIAAAEAEQQPVIIQIYHRLMDDPNIASLAAMMCSFAKNASIPVAVHLDHGTTFKQVVKAVECGFSSVMFDGSQLSFDENIEQTCEAAEYAHKHGISIEGEIGHVPINGTAAAEDIPLSTVEEAVKFAAITGVDSLAVSVGTAHGYYRQQPKIDIERGRSIAAAVSVPLVLHGGSGTPPAQVAELVRAGFAKINIATEFQHIFEMSLAEELQSLKGSFMPLDKVMWMPTEKAVKLVREHIRSLAYPSTRSPCSI